jgi:hypothetical protein
MVATLIGWVRMILAYVVSGMRILGAACSVYSDYHDQKGSAAPRRWRDERG